MRCLYLSYFVQITCCIVAFYKGFLVSYHYIQVWVLIYTYYIICNVPTGIPNNDMNITQVNCCGLVSISII